MPPSPQGADGSQSAPAHTPSYSPSLDDGTPSRKRRRLWLALGVGAVVTVVAANVLATGAKGESGLPEAAFALALPTTLLDGRYELTQDRSDTVGQSLKDVAVGDWADHVTDVKVAAYGLGGVEADGALLISGMSGRFRSVVLGRNTMMQVGGAAEGVTVAVQPKDFQPAGAGTTVTCEVVTQKRPDATLTFPVCAWADGNTVATVAEMTQEAYTRAPSEVDLEAAARTTLQVRSDVRKPLD